MNETAGKLAGGVLSDRLLINTLREFAYRDSLFAAKQKDSVDITLGNVDPIADFDNAESSVQSILEFHAVRQRYHDEAEALLGTRSKELVVVAFELGRVTVTDFVSLPQYVLSGMTALEVYDEMIDAPVFKKKQRKHYQISTADRRLQNCECVAYLGPDDENIQNDCQWLAAEESLDESTKEHVRQMLGHDNILVDDLEVMLGNVLDPTSREQAHDVELIEAAKIYDDILEKLIEMVIGRR